MNSLEGRCGMDSSLEVFLWGILATSTPWEFSVWYNLFPQPLSLFLTVPCDIRDLGAIGGYVSCRLSVPQPGIEGPLQWESLNHCTTRKVPIENFLKHTAHPVTFTHSGQPFWPSFLLVLPTHPFCWAFLFFFFFWLSLFFFTNVHCSHILSRETDIIYFIAEHFRGSQNILRVFGVHLWAEGYWAKPKKGPAVGCLHPREESKKGGSDVLFLGTKSDFPTECLPGPLTSGPYPVPRLHPNPRPTSPLPPSLPAPLGARERLVTRDTNRLSLGSCVLH